MPDPKLLGELGPAIATYRPLRRWVAWAVVVVPSLVFGAVFLFAPGHPWAWAVGAAACFFVVATAAFGELLFVEHRLHKNGLVLRSALPFTATYVVPLAAVEADTVHTGPYYRTRGLQDVRTTVSRRYRQTLWPRPTVRFTGLSPNLARELGKGRLGWRDAVSLYSGISPTLTNPDNRTEWILACSDAEETAARIREAAR